MVGPIIDTGYYRMCSALEVLDSHAYPPYRLKIAKEHCFKTLEYIVIGGDNRKAFYSPVQKLLGNFSATL